MQRHLFSDAIEYALSLIPDDVVSHFANSHTEFLQGVRACVDNCVDEFTQEIDARVEGSRKRRDAGKSDEAKTEDARVTIEEETES